MPDDYDIIFITNPTDLHIETLNAIHEKGKHFFIEKPIISLDKINEAENFKWREGTVYYVACPLRYTSVIQYIKNSLDFDNVYSIRCISSSYLPDWRPGTDYRDCYSAHRDMGGGVSIDLIHEWDYITYLLGFPKKVLSSIGKKSNLEIDSDDYAAYIAEYSNLVAELHLDYFGRKTIREISFYGRDDTIVADLIGGTIQYCISGKTINLQEDRDDYCKRELEHFLDIVEGKVENDNAPQRACEVLKLTQGIV